MGCGFKGGSSGPGLFTCLVLLAFGLALGILAWGCRTLPPGQGPEAAEQWVCPEFADLPLRQGRYQEAIQQHLRVLRQDTGNALAYYHLGYAWGQLGEHHREVAEYRRAMELGLEREDLFYNLGMAYGELGAYERAEQAFSRAVSMVPENGENHRALGMAYYHDGDFEEAVASCRKATVLSPQDPAAWHCLALTLAAAGRPGESQAALEQLQRLDGTFPVDPFLLDLPGAPPPPGAAQ